MVDKYMQKASKQNEKHTLIKIRLVQSTANWNVGIGRDKKNEAFLSNRICEPVVVNIL